MEVTIQEEGQADVDLPSAETPKLKCNVRKWIDSTAGRHKGFVPLSAARASVG